MHIPFMLYGLLPYTYVPEKQKTNSLEELDFFFSFHNTTV